MTICNTCTLNVLDAHAAFVDDPDLARTINGRRRRRSALQRPHPDQPFPLGAVRGHRRGAAAALVRRPLTGLTVAAFYGCHITRPPQRYKFVDSRNNVALERLAEILGCRRSTTAAATECCGFHTAAHDERIAIKLTGQHIQSAKTNGAQAMVTPCPLCHTVLDSFQPEIEKDLGHKLDMPILPPAAARSASRSAFRPRRCASTRHMIDSTQGFASA